MNYTKEFENWWEATYQGNIMEFVIKQIAYAAWQHQQETIDELTKENESLIDTADKL